MGKTGYKNQDRVPGDFLVHDKQTKAEILLAFCLKMEYNVFEKSILISVAETHRKFKPVLAGKGSSGPDWFNIFDNQALYRNLCYSSMNPQKIPAGLYCG